MKAGATADEKAVPVGGSATEVVTEARVEATTNKKATMEAKTGVMAEATTVEVMMGAMARVTTQTWRGAPDSGGGRARN